MVKIVSANFYVGNKQPKEDARLLGSLGADVIGVQEGHGGNIGDIREVIKEKYLLYVGANGFGAPDVPIFVDRDLKVKSFKSFRVSRRSQKKNIGMPRNAGVLRFRKGSDDWLFVNTHLNAAVQDRSTGLPLSRRIKRVYEFIRSMQKLNKIILRAQRRGEHVILVGDLNFRDLPRAVEFRWSPTSVFKRRKLQWRSDGLDWVVWSKSLRLEEYETIGTGQTGSDHPWLVATLKPKR